MLHLATHWPQHASSTFWPQAIEYAIWVFNRMPNMVTGISPNEIWSSVRGDSGSQLSRTHVFGCPVYVLDAALQDGKKIPKWNPRARLGLFLGFSDSHSSQVPHAAKHVIFHDLIDLIEAEDVRGCMEKGIITCSDNAFMEMANTSFT